jgi:hypothetical protein
VITMVHCNGCGFDESQCSVCKKCERVPDLREAYRRGFNAGVDAMSKSFQDLIANRPRK